MSKKLCDKFEYQLPAQADKITELIQKLMKCLNNFNHNIPDVEFRMEIAAREMLANAIEYGCKSTIDQILIKLYLEKDKIFLIVKDPGEGFNWQECNFEIQPVLNERGRGLKMINEVADEIEFNTKGNLIKITFLGGK